MVICDRCEAVFHPTCGADGGRNPVHDGPWYCAVCRGHIHLNGFRDSVEDIGLIDYLWLGRLPDDDGEAARVREQATAYRAQGHELQRLVAVYGSPLTQRWVNVPPIPMRADITRQYHEVLAHARGARLAETLMSYWWW